MNELAVKFIGSEVWRDRLYGSGLYFVPQQTRMVPFLTARKLLQHVDLFEQGSVKEAAADDTAMLLERAGREEVREGARLDETFDVFGSVSQMDKNSLADFAKRHFQQDLDRRKSVETLRDEVRGLIDRFGLA